MIILDILSESKDTIPQSIVNIVVAVISSFTVIVSIWFKEFLTNSAKKKSAVSMEDKSSFYLEMDKTCSVIREALKADGSYLAYFHNGGVFSNGITMDKFTVVGEDYNDKLKCIAYKKVYYSTMINYMSYAYHRLLVDNRYVATSTQDVADITFRSDLLRRKIASIYMFSIKDSVTDKPIGFFALEYMDGSNVPIMNESIIWKYQNRLCRLLNMTVLS